MKILIALVVVLSFQPSLYALDEKRLVDAIGRAENSKAHPYGIMRVYRHTTARQACLNTVHHRLAEWRKNGSIGDPIDFIAKTYAPQNAANDPKHLNNNWARNVRWFYQHNRKLKQ